MSRPQRSEHHYYDSSFIVVQVENILYHLPAAILRKHSSIFESILSLPRGVRAVEGLSDDHPIVLAGYKSAEFDCLLDYLFGSSSTGHEDSDDSENPRAISVTSLISLLKMCTVFNIGGGRAYSITKLEHHPDLNLPTKLWLCLQYKIVMWLVPAFRELVALPTESIPYADLDKIPAKILHSSIHVQSRIRNHRLTLAALPPPIVEGFSCLTPFSCAAEWEKTWKDGPAEMFRHPDIFYSGREILSFFDSPEMDLVCSSCRDASIANVKDSGCLLMEEDFVEEQISDLIMWFNEQ
ncbi:hypothetical protein BDN67DRAFT_974993 [Paxillus ammoniavirescens]|nr:hypothetical protein BDN67DRAFT_974993 [Paxillus ammoniavirescens]